MATQGGQAGNKVKGDKGANKILVHKGGDSDEEIGKAKIKDKKTKGIKKIF